MLYGHKHKMAFYSLLVALAQATAEAELQKWAVVRQAGTFVRLGTAKFRQFPLGFPPKGQGTPAQIADGHQSADPFMGPWESALDGWGNGRLRISS